MNSLEVTKETKVQQFEYTTSTYKFVGSMTMDQDKNIQNINVQVNKDNDNIGSCSFGNGSISVNIYNKQYVDQLPIVSSDFLLLITDYINKFRDTE